MVKYNNDLDLQLVQQFQNGDEYTIQELMETHSKYYFEFKKKYKYLYTIDKLHFKSSYNLAFYEAVKSFDINRTDILFSSYLYYCIRNRMVKDLDFWTRKDRTKLLFGTVPLDGTVSGKENEMEISNLFGECDQYFQQDFIETRDAIMYALEKAKPELKPYLLDVAIYNLEQAEVVDLTGLSKQVVSYQFKRFKENIKDFLGGELYEAI